MDAPLIELSARRGRIGLRLACRAMGEDLCVMLSGGDREHLGAVALAAPGEDLQSLPRPGHREEDLARDLASRLARERGVAVCVACGIHVDRLRPEELPDILAMAQELTDRLLERLGS